MDLLAGLAEGWRAPGPYALGDRFSAVDLYLFMLPLWHPARTGVQALHPRLGRLMRSVQRRPAVERIWAQHFPPGRRALVDLDRLERVLIQAAREGGR